MSPEPITGTCPVCWNTFTATGSNRHKQTYCSNRCRAAAGRRRKDQTPPPPPATPPRAAAPSPAAVRDCPHCGEPIAIVALLTTPEAARPQLPPASPDVVPIRRH